MPVLKAQFVGIDGACYHDHISCLQGLYQETTPAVMRPLSAVPLMWLAWPVWYLLLGGFKIAGVRAIKLGPVTSCSGSVVKDCH